MNKKFFNTKKDQYRINRGGKSEFLEITCSKCNSLVFVYQKDGPGPLLRTYFDRIVFPNNFSNLQNEFNIDNFKNASELKCPICKYILGIPINYEKEQRVAFRLFQGSVKKKRFKNIKKIHE